MVFHAPHIQLHSQTVMATLSFLTIMNDLSQKSLVNIKSQLDGFLEDKKLNNNIL
jgi:hypothetical protein